jgi:hypothetical protein
MPGHDSISGEDEQGVLVVLGLSAVAYAAVITGTAGNDELRGTPTSQSTPGPPRMKSSPS